MLVTPWPEEFTSAKIRNFQINDFKHFNSLSIRTLSGTSNGVIRTAVTQILIETG